jgi:AraC-like DNA-binding protein
MLRDRNTKADQVDLEWRRLARSAGFKATRLADLVGVSLRTLQRRFRSEYRLTVSEWLTEVRLREAGDRIRAGDRVKEVAIDLGYKQLSHFSREFKRAFGSPPTRVTAASLHARSARREGRVPDHMLNSGPR